ncbi:DUF4249 domain-containing protein [Hymenobacter edaphi]|uniref:DUF4249 domain-containing protein n=1 Tax=Hymenobacter edaphi TaxID=2211146 RepID=A0A328BK55_9BACT|nr:DUF4249 domain-containing protein [Hymenobacter edaphi]RAK67045.1 DUF4249 domain-containing protein [Hymenobacter edaphi]
MNFWNKLIICGGLWAATAGCVESYKPEAISKPVNYLVVDGFINTNGVTSIRLSRTTALDSNKPVPAETRATVTIEEEGGARYPLTEGAAGTYTSANLRLGAGRRVRLYIKTAGPREYASDYTTAKQTPPIDSVTWRADARGLQLYVNAHDATDQTRFYRWDYEETWEFTSARPALYEYRNNRLDVRTSDIYRCWRTEKATAMQLGNTKRLAHDVLREAPLLLLGPSEERLRYRYSILVRQYAQTEEESTYWELLNKNTEQLGTVFGPMPSQLTGNVRCLSNAEEPVIGFVGAQSVTEKRIFVARNQLPQGWTAVTPYDNCTNYDTIPDPLSGRPLPLDHFRDGNFIPVDALGGGSWLSSTPACVDCRTRGTNVRPSFW